MGFRDLFSRTKTAQCGHRTKLKDTVRAYGESTVTAIRPNKDGQVEYCHRCIERMAIRCAWCGQAVFIGDPVTLYVPAPEFTVPEHAVAYQEEPWRLVGCLRMNCAETGGDRAGFWLPPGRVLRVPSPLELMMSRMANGQAPSMVSVSDLSDPDEAMRMARQMAGPREEDR